MSMHYLYGFLLVTLLGASPLQAANTPTPKTEAELVSDSLSITGGKAIWVALRLKPQKGWHTYWRYAGDSGLPTKISWKLAKGFKAGPIHWPAPERILLGPLANFGYHGEVLLLSKITVPKLNPKIDKVFLKAKARWLVCEKICIPEEADLSLALPVTNGQTAHNKKWHRSFQQIRKNMPSPLPWQANFAVRDQKIVLTLKLPPSHSKSIRNILFFPHRYGIIKNAAPQPWKITAQGIVLHLTHGPLVNEKTQKIPGTVQIHRKDGAKNSKKSYDMTAVHHGETL